MRSWYKYQLDFDLIGDVRESGKDVSFADHKRSMAYETINGYASGKDFLDYNLSRQPRFSAYDRYLRKALSKSDRVLSVGSGRCANELTLIGDGYDITCSDLEMPETNLKRFFPELRFVNFDIIKSLAPVEADVVIVLSVFYVFDQGEIAVVLKNIAAGLRTGGRLIIDWGGAGSGFFTYIIDEIVCKYETKTRAFFNRLVKRKNCRAVKKHHGYRVSDKEIISFAAESGFKLVDIWRGDKTTEIERSAVARKLIKLGGPFKILYGFGTFMPYVRMFTFELVKSG